MAWSDVEKRILALVGDPSLMGGVRFVGSGLREGDAPGTPTIQNGFVIVRAGDTEDTSGGSRSQRGVFRVDERLSVILMLGLRPDHSDYGEALDAFEQAMLVIRENLGQSDDSGVWLETDNVVPEVSRGEPTIENDQISVVLAVEVRRIIK